MILDKNQLLKKVDDRLTLLLQNDSSFQAEFQYIQVYYTKKFESIIKDEDKDTFNAWLQKSMIEQFQNGYLMIEQYYNDENAHIDESVFQQPEGQFREYVPEILLEMLQPLLEQDITFDEIVDTDTTHKLIISAVENYEDIRPLIKQTSFDLTCLGARQALIDKSYQLDITPTELITEERKLGNIGDLQFINPEMYIKINHASPNVEFWDLNYWSSNLQGLDKIGEVLVISEPKYIDTKIKVSYHLSILSSIPKTDIGRVADHHLAKLLNYVKPYEIQYHLTLVESFS